jgi:hypothetical protein
MNRETQKHTMTKRLPDGFRLARLILYVVSVPIVAGLAIVPDVSRVEVGWCALALGMLWLPYLAMSLINWWYSRRRI